MTLDRLIEEKNGEVKLFDLARYPELLDERVKLTEAWYTNENGYPLDADLNNPMKVYEWIEYLSDMAAERFRYTEEDYARLIDMNFEEA